MATIQGTIIETGQTIQIEIPTVRVPELPQNILPFDPDDKLPLFDDSENKTVWTGLLEFREYILTGSNEAAQTPVLIGSDLEIIITEGVAGNAQVAVPALAGKTFTLDRRGTGILTTSEYSILPSGGFELDESLPLPVEGEVFFAHIYELQISSPSNSSNVFIDGIANITDSIQLSSIHHKKLLHIAGGSNKVIITLEDISVAAPLNLIIPIETNISNNHQTKVVGKDGQSIYFNNTSQTEVILGKSEYLWLMAGVDGWYVMKASEGLFTVGKPELDYVERLNTVVAKGQLVLRADWPRIIKFLETNPGLVVSEEDWGTTQAIDTTPGTMQTIYPNKGFFSAGDGSTTFRFPDLQNVFFRALNYIGSSDVERSNNIPGSIQRDQLRKHNHDIDTELNGTDGTNNGTLLKDNIGENNNPGTSSTIIGFTGGYETRGLNVGLLPLIRV